VASLPRLREGSPPPQLPPLGRSFRVGVGEGPHRPSNRLKPATLSFGRDPFAAPLLCDCRRPPRAGTGGSQPPGAMMPTAVLGHIELPAISPGWWLGLSRPPRLCALRALTLGVAGTGPATTTGCDSKRSKSAVVHGNALAPAAWSSTAGTIIAARPSATIRSAVPPAWSWKASVIAPARSWRASVVAIAPARIGSTATVSAAHHARWARATPIQRGDVASALGIEVAAFMQILPEAVFEGGSRLGGHNNRPDRYQHRRIDGPPQTNISRPNI